MSLNQGLAKMFVSLVKGKYSVEQPESKNRRNILISCVLYKFELYERDLKINLLLSLKIAKTGKICDHL